MRYFPHSYYFRRNLRHDRDVRGQHQQQHLHHPLLELFHLTGRLNSAPFTM